MRASASNKLFSEILKQKRNLRCQTSWPCKNICPHAFEACPKGWFSIGDGSCMAPDFYKVSGCPLLQRFNGWTNDMKSEFAKTCGVEWLCSEEDPHNLRIDGCVLDLSACP